eukprot:TRINITY_DN7676_c0_g1_i1.p1 TRINITY_DN7676_c0_g1~~TRINITY_DN7676_c0_g1_i1.p1  ORF type:complete len:1191 (-),score=328.00 TRINITY_DN7676_c0_g1_i1:50-3622(-)
MADRRGESEIADLKYELSCLKATVDSQFAAIQDIRNIHQHQEGSLATHNSTITDVEGDMRQVLGAVKQLDIASKSQAASIRALEIASKSQSAAVQQLQSALRDEKTVTRAIQERLDKLEQNLVAGIADTKSVAMSNRTTCDELQKQLGAAVSEVQSLHAMARTQTEGYEDLDAAVRSTREQLAALEGTLHPLFLSVEQLESQSKSLDSQRAKASGDTEQTVQHMKSEVQGILAMLKQFDARLTDHRDKMTLATTRINDTNETVNKLASSTRQSTQQVEAATTTHESAINYLKETLKQQGFAIQRLKLGATGSAPGTPVGTPRSVSEPVSTPSQATGFLSIAGLEAKVKQHENLLEDLDRITRQQQSQMSEMFANLQSEASAFAKLQTQTEYDFRQVRTTVEAHDFAMHEMQESTKQMNVELQHLLTQHKEDEKELHRLMATSKYQQLSVQQLESAQRTMSTDVHHLQDVTSTVETKVSATLADIRTHDTAQLKFRADMEAAVQAIQKSLDGHTSQLYEVVDTAKQASSAVEQVEVQVAAHDSLITSHVAATDSMMQQLRTAVEALETDVRQSLTLCNTHTAQLHSLEQTVGIHEASVQEAKSMTKAHASNEHQATLKVTALDQAVQKLTQQTRQFATSSAQVKTMLDAQEQALQKLRDQFDASLTQLRSSVKSLESDSAQLKVGSKTQETSFLKLHNQLQTLQSELSDVTTAARVHDKQLQSLAAQGETVHAAVSELNDGGISTAGLQNLQRNIESIRITLQQHNDAIMTHDRSVLELSSAWREADSNLAAIQRHTEELNSTVSAFKQQDETPTAAVPVSANVQRDIDVLRAATQKLQTASVAHDQALEDMRATLTDIATNVNVLRGTTGTQAENILRLQEVTNTVAKGAQSDSRNETREFINSEALTKCRDLLRPTVTAADKMIIMGWVARNIRFLETSTIHDAISNFRDYANSNRDAFSRTAGAKLPEVIQGIVSLLDSSQSNTVFIGQLLEILECVTISDSNLDTALSLGIVTRLLRLAVSPTDDIKTKSLSALQTAARNDSCVMQILENSGCEALVSLLRWDTPAVVYQACGVVRQCLRVDEACRAFQSLQIYLLLVELLEHSDGNIRENAAGALRNGTRKDDQAQMVADVGGIEALVRVGRDTHPGASKTAIAALRNIARLPRYQKQIHSLGGLDMLGLRYPVVK